MAAFDPATLDRWRALAIVDRDGTTVGTVEEFYLDRETGHPTWALVNTGLFGANQTFVPLVYATEIDDGLQVPYEKRHIKDAPQLDPGDELTPDDEATLFAHYGVDYLPSPSESSAGGSPDAGPGSGEAEGSSEADPGGSDEAPRPGESGSHGSLGPLDAGPGSGEAPGPVRAGPGGDPTEGRRAGVAEAVPAEPEPAEPSDTPGSHEASGGVPAEPGTAEPDETMQAGPYGSGPTPEQRREDPDVLKADPSRPVPVEPGLPGSTATTTSGPTATTVAVGSAPPQAQEEPQPPGDSDWEPGTAGAFEEPDPADRPTGSSDRWREAKLAAERDRIARAAAAQPEERSPLERAKRRLERLVGGGQAHDEADAAADRDAAERARRARLGLDENDSRSR